MILSSEIIVVRCVNEPLSVEFGCVCTEDRHERLNDMCQKQHF